jgi:hypothetical protein
MSRSSNYYPPGVSGNEPQITGEPDPDDVADDGQVFTDEERIHPPPRPTVMADSSSVGEQAPRWPEAKGYGLYVLHCHCGWTTLKRTGAVAQEIQSSPPQVCEACQSPSLSGASRREWSDGNESGGIACWVMTVSEKRSERVNEHARKHGLLLYQVSPKRWQWLKEAHGSSITYRDGQARAFVQLEAATDPLDWQGAMKYLREKAPELPAYLAK